MSTRPLRALATVVVGLAVGGLFGGGLVRAASKRAPVKPLPAPGPSLIVPYAIAPIVPDGELEEVGWSGPIARTGAFHAALGAAGKPYSDARFVYRNGDLYVVLYAADEDIRAAKPRHDDPLDGADAFQLVFHTSGGERVLDVSPRGVITDGARSADGSLDLAWESHAEVGVDTDGAIDDPSDIDEEWVVEMKIPLASLGMTGQVGEHVGLSIRRCDDVKGLGRLCAGWGTDPGALGTLVLGRGP